MAKYRIDHPLFADIDFQDEDLVKEAAERLAKFILRSTERIQVSIDVLLWSADPADGPKPAFYVDSTVHADLGVNWDD